MSILTRARTDFKRFTEDTAGFGVAITLIRGGTEYALSGLHTKHHISIDENGAPVNSKNASITIMESTLSAAGFPIRNAEDEVQLIDTQVRVKDSTGNVKNYVITEHFPDETVGNIVCILQSDGQD